jgi:hypothetical protein
VPGELFTLLPARQGKRDSTRQRPQGLLTDRYGTGVRSCERISFGIDRLSFRRYVLKVLIVNGGE